MHLKDAKGILSAKNGINIYRGCTHGCIYCDSRSLCYQMDHEFTDVEVKRNAVSLLETALKKKRKKCMVATGAMSDPYLPIERQLKLTGGCLEVIERTGNGAAILTKSDLIMRDLERLKSIARKAKCVVQMTLTTMDEHLCTKIEPQVCLTSRRLEVLAACREAGIPTIVWLSPVLPFLTDSEENIRGLVKSCSQAGVYGILHFGMGMTLRNGNREYFYQCLDKEFPGLKRKYQQRYGHAFQISCPDAHGLERAFYQECGRAKIHSTSSELFQFLQQFEARETQLSLF